MKCNSTNPVKYIFMTKCTLRFQSKYVCTFGLGIANVTMVRKMIYSYHLHELWVLKYSSQIQATRSSYHEEIMLKVKYRSILQ